MSNHEQPHASEDYSESDLEAIRYVLDLQILAGLTDKEIAYKASTRAAKGYSHTIAEEHGKHRQISVELLAERDYARKQLDLIAAQADQEELAQEAAMPWGEEKPADLGGIELAMVVAADRAQEPRNITEMRTVSAADMTYPGGYAPSIGYGQIQN